MYISDILEVKWFSNLYAMFKIQKLFHYRDQRQTCWPKIISMTHLGIFMSPLICVLMQAEDLILISNIAYVPKSYKLYSVI